MPTIEALVHGSIHLSVNEFCFEQLIEKLPRASTVRCCTYGVPITIEQSPLWQLTRTDSAASVLLFVNVPQSTNRLKQLDALTRLSTSGPHIQLYLCDRLHAKVMVVDDFIYLGSANISAGSQSNYECGFVCESSDSARTINRWLHETVISDADCFDPSSGSCGELILRWWRDDSQSLLDATNEGWDSACECRMRSLSLELLSAGINDGICRLSLSSLIADPKHVRIVRECARGIVDSECVTLPAGVGDQDFEQTLLSQMIEDSPENCIDAWSECASSDADELYSAYVELRRRIEPICEIVNQAYQAAIQ